MISQIYAMEEYTGEKISNTVVMGSGEPLANYDALLDFIFVISDSDGKGMSQRNITVSTSGLVPVIRRLAEEKLQINLALSLHAPDDEKRRALMPVASRYPLSDVMDAMSFYYDMTHRRLTFEYALVEGNNDSASDAEALSGILRGMNCVVNLIPVNPIKESGYKRPGREACLAFRGRLESLGINATVRRELGSDIDSACGQLRASRVFGD
jgi:23S rRNA (adenine2503-C2)-methyltransferase